ncbi:piwi-like protein Siwi [Bacillus rossius redtenbacheri]|uniref:piwi-like protein Siwi n=1 Tax=Bacillus rossius redtenbacheri TaxID=93214 RepID=UPI002FDEE17D
MQKMQVSGADEAGRSSVAASVGCGFTRGRRLLAPEAVIRTRPDNLNSKLGTSGQPIRLTANYFMLETRPDWVLYQYRVDFSPDEDLTVIRKGLLRDHKAKFGGYLFDGTMLFTTLRLNPDPMEVFSKREGTDAQVRITIRLVGEVDSTDYQYLQVFNILMRKCLRALKLQLVGRNYFDAQAKVAVNEYKLELWPGYVTSIRQHEQSILMCAEITHKVMRQDTALGLLQECLARSNREYKELFMKAITGSIVLTDYNNRTYRIDDVDWQATPATPFEYGQGQQITFMDYYKQKYNIRITEPTQPLLVSRAKMRERRAGMSETIQLVPELCRLTGLTDDMRGNFHLMRALAEHTRIGPEARIEKLLVFSRRLLNEESVRSDFKEWNMTLSNRLVEFNGRVLPPERIILGKDRGQDVKCEVGQDADWTRNLRSNSMCAMVELSNWVLVAPSKFRRDAQGFAQTLQKAAAGMRFMVATPQIYDLDDYRTASYTQALDQITASKRPQIIMVVVPNNRVDLYGAIKKKCAVERAIPTQVILAKNLASKGVMSIATKVAIQLNCKIGGFPWTVEIPLNGLMVIGYDVCHDTGSKGKSYGALVASLDKTFGRYFSTVSAHTSGEELSAHLAVNITKALHKYKAVNQALPSRIVIYRDGVGEGQLPYVARNEVNILRKHLASVYGDTPVMLCVIVVTKRINTRLFSRGGNPPPGTVADDVVTNPEKYDFFLVSQSVRQGTVSPTSYNVIFDTLGLPPDRLQRLTYKFCHLYFNWSGTVRVPAPCQYAHKLAFLVGQALHRPPHSQLEDFLYFL